MINSVDITQLDSLKIGNSNNRKKSLSISDFQYLQYIDIRENVFTDITSLSITNNPLLQNIWMFDSMDSDSSNAYSFQSVDNLELQSISWYLYLLKDLPQLRYFNTSKRSFYEAKSLYLTGIVL